MQGDNQVIQLLNQALKEEHVDSLKPQIELVERTGLQNYLQTAMSGIEA